MTPDPKDYLSSDGEFLRQLYAVALMRALNPRERRSVEQVLAGESA